MGIGRLILVFVLTVLLTLSCGEHREFERYQSEPDTVISIDHTVEVRPGNYKASTAEAVAPLAASSVSVEAKVTKTSQGYFLNLAWQFEGREPKLWEIQGHSDLDDGREEGSKFISRQYISPGEKREFVSNPMDGNRVYKFFLIGQVNEFTGDHTIDGSVLYKTIHVNLKGLP